LRDVTTKQGRRVGALEVIVTIKRILMVCSLAVFGLAATFLAINSAGWVAPSLNPAPLVIPSLREWHGSTGSFVLASTSRIAVDSSSAGALSSTAQAFQSDLLAATGRTLPVVTASASRPGDLFLTLRDADPAVGDEGYFAKVSDTVVITGNTSRGVFYGTRTALQILLQDPEHTHIPRGTARDYPNYKERGFMLDVGRKFFSIGFLEDYVRFMAWFKMNDFHIHFSDNEVDAGTRPDWMHRYAAFRLNSSRFPGLAAKDGSYTKQDIRALQDIAKQYAVTITPEIDAPAHAMAFTQYQPALASPTYSKEMLDLSNPASYTFMNAIWNEFLPWFDTMQVHIGADEYDTSDPDNYRRFINTYDAYMKQHGKTVRIWGSLTEMKSSVKVNNDVVIDLWDNDWANPVDMVRQGFNVINANDKLLYIVPKAGYFHDYLDTKALYERWEPYIFDLSKQSVNLQPGDPHLLGGMFAEWNDKLGSKISDADVHARVKPAMPTVGEKLWSGTTTRLTFHQFQQLAQALGDAPGTHLPALPTPGASSNARPASTSAAPVLLTAHVAARATRDTLRLPGAGTDEWISVERRSGHLA
jgi:hexosaminidase